MPKFASVDDRHFFPHSCFSLLEQALIRDNWRCPVTGLVEQTAPKDIIALVDFTRESGASTECAHIIPESTFFGVDPKSDDNLKVRG